MISKGKSAKVLRRIPPGVAILILLCVHCGKPKHVPPGPLSGAVHELLYFSEETGESFTIPLPEGVEPEVRSVTHDPKEKNGVDHIRLRSQGKLAIHFLIIDQWMLDNDIGGGFVPGYYQVGTSKVNQSVFLKRVGSTDLHGNLGQPIRTTVHLELYNRVPGTKDSYYYLELDYDGPISGEVGQNWASDIIDNHRYIGKQD